MHFKCERPPRVTNCAFDQTNSFYLFVLCLFVPYPHGYKVSRGGPGYCTFDQSFYAKNEIDCLFISPQVQK